MPRFAGGTLVDTAEPSQRPGFRGPRFKGGTLVDDGAGPVRAQNGEGAQLDLPPGQRVPSTNVYRADGSQVFKDGVPLNVTAGLNDFLYGVAGAPAAAGKNLINWGVAGVNKLRGAENLTDGMITADPVLGREWIAQQFEKIGTPNPDKVIASTPGEKVARMAGEGIGMTLAPELALATAARTGMIAGRAFETLAPLVGRGDSMGRIAGNAAVGGAGGAGAQLAMDAAPDNLDPLAALGGGLAGGLAAATVGEVPNLVRSVARGAGDYVAPLTEGGRRQMAGRTLRESATNPELALEKLADVQPRVPGSMPTTAQATGDLGLLGLERGIEANGSAPFAQRRADQNSARLDALGGIQKGGDATGVVRAVRGYMDQIDRQTADVLATASQRARTASEGLGAGKTPDVAGEAVRANYEAARATVKAKERALWDAVDPEQRLAMEIPNARSAAAQIGRDMPATAKPMEGEEAAIFGVARQLGNVVKFSDLTALQSRLKAAMREERFKAGESDSWRRMSLLNGAIQRDLESVVARKVSADAQAVAAGHMRPQDATSARLSAAMSPTAGNRVFTATGRPVDVEYRVVDAGQLVPSNLDNLSPNPAYPQALQPRNRTRTASEVQIAKMAGELQPERLGASPSAAEGAPIIGPDGLVESGNARVLAIRRAYQQGGEAAQRYRAFLQQQGFDVGGMANPVLVRVRKSQMTDAERVRFAQEANSSAGLTMSAGERAASDASRLDSSVLDLYQGGDVGSAANRNFVRAFLGRVADPNEAGAFVTRDGTLSLEGAQRVRGAMLSAAYDDAPLVEALIESGDENIRAFGHALGDIAGDVAGLRLAIREGAVSPGADLSAPLVEAAQFVREARRRGQSLSTAAAQMDAFSRLSQSAEGVLRLAYGTNLSARLSRSEFEGMMRTVIGEAKQQTVEARLFGEPANAADILATVGGRNGGYTTQGVVSVAPRGPRARGGESGYPEGQFGPPSAGAQTAVGREGGGSAVLEPQLEPNFSQADLERLNAARAATRGRAETFDNPTLAPIRRREMASGPYAMPSSAVPGRIFAPGPKSYDAVLAYRRAVGDGQAMQELEAYAVDRLRRVALRDDGTIDPGKLATWRRQHSDALRAFPALDARLADVGKASEAMANAAAARKAAMDAAQLGAVGRLIGIEDPADVARLVGGIFSRQDAVNQMFRLRAAIGSDEAGRQGLRQAVADFMVRKLVSNTEAAASGREVIKSDAFQTFVKQNRSALKVAGFTDDEIKLMTAIADDLQQANRSVAGVRIPGGSNTAQDLNAAARVAKAGGASAIKLLQIAAGGSGGLLGGPVTAVLGAGAGYIVAGMREAGMRTVDDLVRAAMLDPALARMLLARTKGRDSIGWGRFIGERLRRGAQVGAVMGANGERSGKQEPINIVVRGGRNVPAGAM